MPRLQQLVTEVVVPVASPELADRLVLRWPPALTRDDGFQRFRTWLRATVSDQEKEDVRR